jgi:hypothetical protein
MICCSKVCEKCKKKRREHYSVFVQNAFDGRGSAAYICRIFFLAKCYSDIVFFFSPCLPNVCTACVQTIPPNPLTNHTHAHTQRTHAHSNIMRNLQPALAVASRARTFRRWCYICVRILLYVCVLILLYMCPHTTIYASSCYYTSLHISATVGAVVDYYVCVLILLHMCPHTTIYVSSYFYICVRILLQWVLWWTTIFVSDYVSAYYYICVLILL